MKIFNSKDKSFPSFISSVMERGRQDTAGVEAAVREIIDAVRRDKDKALTELTRRFDGADIKGSIEVGKKEINSAYKSIPGKERELLELAASRITSFHKRQVQKSWLYKDKYKNLLGQKVTPVERAGIYVPGGKAAYPSTVLMNAIPAKVAGVDEVVMVTPPGKNGINKHVLAAAKIAGVDRVFRVGGAQSIAALAFGTETIPRADKITGPGNIYVATAKRLVFGTVDIDMVAGPSEILIINDGTGDADWIAADLLSQAEHDEMASSILITTSRKMAEAVKNALLERIEWLPKKAIAEKSINDYGAIIIARDLLEAAAISNNIAPEHLELFVKRPERLIKYIRNAGAVFMGSNTPEAAGDYIAGPNHTLPTGGTARFSSPLGVEDFIKKTSIIGFSKKGIQALGQSIKDFAGLEGLVAHAKSASIRLKK